MGHITHTPKGHAILWYIKYRLLKLDSKMHYFPTNSSKEGGHRRKNEAQNRTIREKTLRSSRLGSKSIKYYKPLTVSLPVTFWLVFLN